MVYWFYSTILQGVDGINCFITPDGYFMFINIDDTLLSITSTIILSQSLQPIHHKTTLSPTLQSLRVLYISIIFDLPVLLQK